MRKLFWCCAAAALAVAVLGYWAADQARQYPDSLLGRCAVCAYRVGVDYSPLRMLGPSLATRISTLGGVAATTGAGCGAECASPPAACPKAATVPAYGMPKPEQIMGMLRKQGLAVDDRVIADAGAEDHPEDQCPGGASLSGEAGFIEESEEAPKVMPVMPEDEHSVPVVMPYIEEKDAAHAPVGFWMGLIRQTSREMPTTTTSYPQFMPPSDSYEQSEPGPTTHTSKCEENPSDNRQCPRCPAAGRCSSSMPHQDRSSKAQGDHQHTPLPTSGEPDAEDHPTSHGLDTMEFRPSDDAQEGEFDQRPM